MGRTLAITLSCAALTLGFQVARASGAETESGFLDKYLSIESYTVEPVAEIQDSVQGPEDDCLPPRQKSESIPGTDELNSIIAIGEKLWKIIEAGRPVVSFKAPVVHALPYHTICWHDLESWKAPKSSLWQVTYKNGFGMNVVNFKYRVSHTGGGRFEGKGQYLANVTVMPATIDVAWGFDFNASAEVGRAINLGTRDNPLAGLQLMVLWNVKSKIKESISTESLFVQGDGQLLRQ